MIDLDNTLADRDRAIRSWADEFCRSRELPTGAPEWILDADDDGYTDRRTVIAAIKERYGLPDPVDELLAAYRRRVVEMTSPTDGAVEALASMRRRGWTISIVTNGSSGQQNAKIDTLGLRALADAVCVSGDVGVKKPDPAIFQMAADMVGASLDGAWMVGDSPHHDILGADRIGVRTAWLHRGRTWSDDTVSPTVTIGSLGNLVEAIERVTDQATGMGSSSGEGSADHKP